MKLYLTSNGLEDDYVATRFQNVVLSGEAKDMSCLVVSIQDKKSDAFYLEKTINELKKIGIINIDVFALKEEKFDKTDREYDIIYVCGGNTFLYLDRIRKTGLDKFIIDSVTKDKSIYVGVSAGSIIAGPNIEISGWGTEGDSNNISLTNLEGLNLTNIVVYPHYTEELKSEVEEFKKKHGYQVHELEDNQALRLSYSDIGKLKDVMSLEIIKR